MLLILIPIVVLSESVEIVFVGEPGVSIYVNASFVGTIGNDGKLKISLNIGGRYYVSADGDWFIQVGEPDVVKIGENVIVFLNVVKASRIRVLSNVYPVSVFVDGEYYGKVESPEDTVKVPSGYREVVLKVEGFKEIEKKVALEWKKVVAIPAEFEKLPKDLKLYLSSDTFSPNGDWYEDTLKIHIYSTFSSTATLKITGEDGFVLEKELHLEVGDNVFEWDGEGAKDGEYTIRVKANGITREEKVKLDRSVYTYRKEFTLLIFLLLISLAALPLFVK